MSQSPFKFLDSYTREDKDIFFGRETEVEDIYTKVFQSKILLVYGASGTGKSSLISCGLGNKFQETDWLPISVRRGTEINESLRQQLEKVMLTPLSSKANVSLVKMLKSVYLDYFKPIFLVFDQFEELFIFGDKEEWASFVANVREVLDSEVQVRFVFIIRGEYLEFLTEFEAVLPEIFSNRIRIEKMTRANAVSCITGPCSSSNIEVEEHFPENLLTKLSPNKTEIELTYLQVFLDRILKKAKDQANGRIAFSNKLLNELGNVGDVLSQFLDEQIELIPESEKALTLLKAFVSTDATKRQITSAQAGAFVKTIGHNFDQREIDRLIQELVNRRILKDKDEAGRYELRHDSIAAKVFEKITSYERDLIEVNHFITYAYGEHEKRDFLLNESDLAYIAPFEKKLDLSSAFLAFIEKSKTAVSKSKRSKKRIVTVALTFGILSAVSLLAFIYAFDKQIEANKNAELANEQSQEALTQKESAEQQKTLAQQQKLEADNQAKIAREQSAIALTQRQEAERQRQLAASLQLKAQAGEKSALEEKAKADAASLEAQRQAQIAEKNSNEALRAKEEATRFRMLAIAQAMGAKAIQLQDRDQKILVAQQAYLFNKQYNGYEYQSDIYNGLYSAYEAVNGNQFNTTAIHKGVVKGLVAIAPNIFITAGADGKIVKTNLNTSPATVTLVESFPYVFQSIALSQDLKTLAIGSEEGKFIMYDAISFTKLKEVTAHKSALWAMVFDENGNLYTAGSDQNILKWSRDIGNPVEIIHTGSIVNALSYNNSKRIMAAGLANGEVALIKISDDGAVRIGKIPSTKPVTQVRFNNTGTMLAVGKDDGSILLWDIVGSEMSQSLTGHQAMVSDLRFNANDSFLLSTSYDGTSMLWNMKSVNNHQVVFADHGGWVMQGCFDREGRDLVTVDAIGSLRFFSLKMEFYSTDLCSKLKRNMTEKEWNNFVGSDIPYQKTCDK